MVDCVCQFGKGLGEDQESCPYCGTDLTLLHRLKGLPGYYADTGLRLMEQGQLDKAIECLMTAISLAPGSAEAYYLLGKAYAQKELFDDAIFYFDRALEIDGDSEKITAAKAKAAESKKKIFGAKLRQERSNLFLRRIIIPLPIIAFIIGLIILPVFHALFDLNREDPLAYAEKIKNELASFTLLEGVNIDVSSDSEALIISGTVFNDIQKNFIKEMVHIRAEDKKIDFSQLLVKGDTGKEYVVKTKDNLYKIAQTIYENGNLWTKIYNNNKDKISNPHLIYKGQILRIPAN